MYLSRLEIFGFKSFARKTMIDFHDGITAIVGPNGCGKSNIVDAIRWVLGEQRAGLLRSDSMQNVIFNGTRTQKPLGMAEVSLTIQNNRNILPIEYSEVVVTRRLFRSGESQYLLNHTPCRLKDINDLFMDTGMGPNAYSVIELGMVETILNGRPEERRQIFEEAAGVTKYKIRRKAAFRKLEATEQDLIRLTDIISEVEKTVNALRRQVKKATRYRDLSRELRQLELDYSAFNLRRIYEELGPLEEKSKALTREKQRLSAQVATREADIEKQQLELLELERQLNARGSDLATNQQRIREKEEEILVCQERISAAKASRTRAGQEIVELEKRAADTEEERAAIAELLAEMRAEVDKIRGEFEKAEARLQQAQKQYHEQRERGKALEAERLQHLESAGSLEKTEEHLRTRIEYVEQRLQVLREQGARTEAKRTALQEQAQEWEQQKASHEEKLQVAEELISELVAQLDREREQVETMRATILHLQAEIQSRQDRASLLRKVLESYEDYPEGVRHVLMEKLLPNCCHGTLGDHIKVDPRHRVAIEAALGEAAVALVVDGALDAVRAIDDLKAGRKGTATFLPIEKFPASEANERESLPDASGVIGWAMDLVDLPPNYRAITCGLLARTVVVDSLNTALSLAPQFEDRQITLVTLDGDIVYDWGAIRGGGSDQAAPELLGRKALLEQLEQEITERQQNLLETEQQMQQSRERVGELTAALATAQQEQKKLSATLREIEIAIGRTNGDLRRLESQLAENAAEQANLEAECETLRAEAAKTRPVLEQIASDRSKLDKQYAAHQQRAQELEAQAREAEQAVQEIRLQHVRRQSDLAAAEQNAERLQQTAHEIAQTIDRRRQEITSAGEQIGELEARIRAMREKLHEDFAERKELEDVLQQLRQNHLAVKSAVDGQEKELKSLRSCRDALAEELHRAELRLSELRMKARNIEEQMREAYETDIRQHAVPASIDLQATAERINELKQKIRALGPINMLALKDYEAEKERLDFLLAQKTDLLEAEENLKETIRVINRQAHERFTAVFSKVRENFIQVFKSFFENGAADLRLSDEDPLEAEIIIEASPKGKKLGSLALLSGGEKTLTAISLLFSIYLVKPSPFCILDEVDAPLDDANIGRFTGALQTFSDNTQFIVVTHNKLTMTAAQQLYGITMEEPGISKVVSVKFEENNGQLQETAAESSDITQSTT